MNKHAENKIGYLNSFSPSNVSVLAFLDFLTAINYQSSKIIFNFCSIFWHPFKMFKK